MESPIPKMSRRMFLKGTATLAASAASTKFSLGNILVAALHPVYAVDDYFLSSANMTDDFLFLAPKRTGITVQPLIDGFETFKVMEQVIAGATRTVHLSIWVFNPSTPLSAKNEVNKILASRQVKTKVSTWGELLSTVAGLGTKVSVLMNDFDPILQNGLHENTWSAYRKLRAEAKMRAQNNMQIMCSLHDATISFGAQTVLENRLNEIISKLNRADFARSSTRYMDMPRLWASVSRNKTTKKFARSTSPNWTVFPASHHQKLCVVDNAIGFCGGLDINRGRLDTKEHKKLWHDVHCRVDGQLAADLDRNFIGRWNREMTAFNSFISSSTVFGRLSADAVTAIVIPASSPAAGSGPASAQLIRTLSTNASFSQIPKTLRADIRDIYEKVIGLAESFIYIENQYVRDGRLANWIIARANQIPSLTVILVLPVAPEEVALSGGADPVTLLGLHLQHDVLTRLKAALGSRVGLYSMVARQGAPKKHATDWAGSRQIYVHSKTMIVDDVWATIGSANTNPRSFQVDTEANIHWYDPASVKKLRLDLWREMMGSPQDIETWTPAQYVPRWNDIARQNLTKKPTVRQGFIVPHDPENPAVQGRSNSQIPNEFAELVELAPDQDYLA